MAQTYLVTGANRGIGLEFARQLTARGDTVVATVRDRDRAKDLLAVAGFSGRIIEVDVADPSSVARLREGLGGRAIDVLVNNAGVSSESKSIESLTAEDLTRVMAVNAIAPVLVAQAALPSLRAGTRKLVFNITSQLGSIQNNTGGSSYGYRASKAALNMFTTCMANELRGEGFTCVCVHPGWVQTDMGGRNATLTPERSVASMLKVMDGLRAADSGKFLNYDGGHLPW